METFRSIRWKFFFKDVLKELDKLIEKVKDQGKDVIKPKKDRITKLTTEIDTKISNIDKNIKSYTETISVDYICIFISSISTDFKKILKVNGK